MLGRLLAVLPPRGLCFAADLAAGFVLTCQAHPLTDRVVVPQEEFREGFRLAGDQVQVEASQGTAPGAPPIAQHNSQ